MTARVEMLTSVQGANEVPRQLILNGLLNSLSWGQRQSGCTTECKSLAEHGVPGPSGLAKRWTLYIGKDGKILVHVPVRPPGAVRRFRAVEYGGTLSIPGHDQQQGKLIRHVVHIPDAKTTEIVFIEFSTRREALYSYTQRIPRRCPNYGQVPATVDVREYSQARK
jgi:hypothetical protein